MFLREKSGRWSPEKIIAFVGACLPALWLAWRALNGELNPARPVNEAIHATGYWTMLFIVFSLAVSPARRLFAAPKLINMRRTLGVTAFCYALLHLTLYVVEQKYDLAKVLSEIVLRIYLTIGFVALIGLIALAATSTDGMIRRLGAQRWNRLHRIVYAIAILGIIHFLMQTKLDISDSAMVAGFLFWLFGYRLMHRYRRRGHLSPVGRARADRRRADRGRGSRLVRRHDRRDVVARVLGEPRLPDGAAPGALGGDRRPRRHVRGLRVVVPLSASQSPRGGPESPQGARESALGRHPGPVRQLMPRPGELPLGVAPCVVLRALGRLGERDLAGEVADQPRHAMRLHRRQQRIEPAGRQARAPRRARRPPTIASNRAAMRLRNASRSGARKIFTASDASSSGGSPSRCHSPNGRPVASSTSSARAIRVRSAGLSCVAGSRADELRVQRGRPFALHPGAHRRPDFLRDRRHRRQPLRQRLEIQPGAADQDRYAPGGASLIQGRRDIREPAPDRIVLRRVHMAIEPVRHPRLLLRRRPRRDDAQVAIDLHRIRIDDRAADLARQRQRQRRLAARGRPCDKHRLLVRRSAMTHVATLISNPARPALDEAALRVAQRRAARHRKRRAGSIPASRPTFPLRRMARTTKRPPNASAARSPGGRSTSWCNPSPHGASGCSSPTWIPP